MAQVLLVEDEPILRELLILLLLAEGHRVCAARDGLEALACVREDRPDVIVLDLALPLVDGRRVLELLEQEEVWRDIPVIVVSAVANTLASWPSKTIRAVLGKPVDPDLVTDLVERLAGERPHEPPRAG